MSAQCSNPHSFFLFSRFFSSKSPDLVFLLPKLRTLRVVLNSVQINFVWRFPLSSLLLPSPLLPSPLSLSLLITDLLSQLHSSVTSLEISHSDAKKIEKHSKDLQKEGEGKGGQKEETGNDDEQQETEDGEEDKVTDIKAFIESYTLLNDIIGSSLSFFLLLPFSPCAT